MCLISCRCTEDRIYVHCCIEDKAESFHRGVEMKLKPWRWSIRRLWKYSTDGGKGLMLSFIFFLTFLIVFRVAVFSGLSQNEIWDTDQWNPYEILNILRWMSGLLFLWCLGWAVRCLFRGEIYKICSKEFFRRNKRYHRRYL